MKKVPRKEDVIRIVMLDPPEHYARGEGIYEWRYMDDKFYVDIIDVEKEINNVMPGRGEAVLDRIQNFGKVFLNIATNEVTT